MSRQALEMAVEALERCVATCFDQRSHDQVMGRPEHFVNQTITAIKETLAQPKQEPVATVESVATVVSESGNQEVTMSWWHEPALPVGTKFYTTPPQRKPLTRDDIIRMAKQAGFPEPEHITSGGDFRCSPDLAYLVALVEAAHGIGDKT